MALSKAEISRLRSLSEKKHREALGLFVVEGEKVVRELLAEKVPFLELFTTGPVDFAGKVEQVHRISPEEMARISHYPTPSTLLAVGRIIKKTWEPAELKQGLTLMLDGVQDAGNVGTLLRIADWFGVSRVVMSPDCADLYSQKVINASMGSFTRVPVFVARLAECLEAIRGNVTVLGCDLEGEMLASVQKISNAVIVMGSEGRGVSAEVAQCLTRRVTIPRYGRAESLNVAVAAGIVCAHLRSAE